MITYRLCTRFFFITFSSRKELGIHRGSEAKRKAPYKRQAAIGEGYPSFFTCRC